MSSASSCFFVSQVLDNCSLCSEDTCTSAQNLIRIKRWVLSKQSVHAVSLQAWTTMLPACSRSTAATTPEAPRIFCKGKSFLWSDGRNLKDDLLEWAAPFMLLHVILNSNIVLAVCVTLAARLGNCGTGAWQAKHRTCTAPHKAPPNVA